MDGPTSIEGGGDCARALDYILNSHEGLSGLPLPSSWAQKGLVYEDLVGYYVVQYTSGKWTAEVGNAVVQEPVYDVEVEFTGEMNFVWKGTVDRSGNVVETEFVIEN